MSFSRREFIGTAVVGSLAVNLPAQQAAGKRPIIVCANNGYPYLDAGFEFLKFGGDTLDAALRVVKGPVDDANDDSVGLGGLTNEEGVVELVVFCVHVPVRRGC